MTRVILGAVLGGLVLAAVVVRTAVAECNPSGADVSFIRTAPYARQILIGRVVNAQPDPDGQGPAQDGVTFTLEVQQVLRGRSIATLPVDHLETGGCIRWLSAGEGDVIALALHTEGSHPTLARATAAWIEGEPRISDPYEILTMAEVLDAAQKPRPPDTATAEPDSQPPSNEVLPVAAALVGSFAILLVTRRGRSEPGAGRHREAS